MGFGVWGSGLDCKDGWIDISEGRVWHAELPANIQNRTARFGFPGSGFRAEGLGLRVSRLGITP